MTKQLHLFKRERPTKAESKVETTAAVDAVTKKAGDEWCEYALGIVREVANSMPEFTTQDITLLTAWEPHDMRALGGVMRHAQDIGLIRWTGKYKPHTGRHMTPVRVWTKGTCDA